jgi:hypothetical protein
MLKRIGVTALAIPIFGALLLCLFCYRMAQLVGALLSGSWWQLTGRGKVSFQDREW